MDYDPQRREPADGDVAEADRSPGDARWREPTGDLDGQTAEAVFSLIARLHREHQLTSLIATHNLSFARRCHRVLRIERGRVEEIAPDSLPA